MRPDSPKAAPVESSALDQATSAYSRAGATELDPRCRPVQLQGRPLVGKQITPPDYSDHEQQTWRTLYTRQVGALTGVASEPFLSGLEKMAFTPDRIPTLREVDEVLRDCVGWRVARSPGLLHERDFFGLLAQRIFPCTDFIRPEHELNYTPAPDLFHDVFGHTPMITHPTFADFYQRMGQAALRANDVEARQLERFYWFTVEFGLIREASALRVYGNGILSSWGEIQNCLSDKVRRVPFCSAQVAAQDYDVWHFQDQLFVIDSYEQLAQEFERWAFDRGLLD